MTCVTRTGRRLEADAVVLAVGISAPAGPSPMAAIEHHPGYVANPWDHDAVMSLAAGRRVLIVGTGLTMIDVALSLSAAGGGPEMLAISRHGELPRAHRPGAPEPGEPAVRPGEHRTIAALAAQIEERARATGDWRAVIDSLRPVTQQLWRELPQPEKQSFLEHYSRRWEVHRSRIAPEIAAQVGALRTAGRLRVAAATVTDVAAGRRADLRPARRGAAARRRHRQRERPRLGLPSRRQRARPGTARRRPGHPRPARARPRPRPPTVP